MQDRLEQLICRNVIYTVYDEDGTYTGTVERDSNGRAYVQDSTHLYIRMKLEKITLKYAQIFIFIFVTFFA